MQETWVWALIWEDSTCHDQLSWVATTIEPKLLSPHVATPGNSSALEPVLLTREAGNVEAQALQLESGLSLQIEQCHMQ